MRSKTTYIDSSLTKKDEWTKQLSSSSKDDLQLEAAIRSEKLGIEQPEYLEFLELLFYINMQEQKDSSESTWLENAETHAWKLFSVFGCVKEALAYINRYENVVKNSKGNAKQLLHDACLFSLPDSDELSDNSSMLVWQQLLISAKPNGPEDEIMRLLPFAHKIAEYIQNSLNRSTIERMVRDEVENDFKRKYELDFKNLGKISLAQWIEGEIKNNSKLVLNDQFAAELQAAYNDKTLYVQYRLAKEKFLPSTIKAKMNTVIPFSVKTPVQYIKKIANTFLYQRAEENPEAADLFFKHRISEDKFNLYLSLTPDNSHAYIPNIRFEGKNIHENYKNFRLEKLNSRDPRAAVLGILTSCCQSFGSQGEACAIHGIIAKKSGFYVVYDTVKNSIIAQCWAWCGSDGNLVFDSIEVAMNYNKHKTMIMDFYVKLAHCLVQQHDIPSVLVGTSGATPEGMKILSPLAMSCPENYSGYRDSRNQKLVAAKAYPLLIETYKEINTDSLLTAESFDDISLSQLEAHQELCFLNLQEPSKRILELFALHRFTTLDRLGCNYLISDWLFFLERIHRGEVEPSLQDIQDFVAKGVNLNSSKGFSILALACMFGSLQTVLFLMEKGALAIKDGYFASPFDIAVENNKLEIVTFFLTRNDIDINKPNNSGETPLYVACRGGYTAIVEHLLKQQDIDINKPNNYGETPLFVACRQGFTVIVEHFLKQQDIDINKADRHGETLFYIAFEEGHTAIIELLLEQKDIDINKPNKRGDTPLMIACYWGRGIAIVELLLKQKGIDINKPNEQGDTPLTIACKLGHIAIGKQLLKQNNIDINKPNKKGETPLLIAYMRRNTALVELLLKHKKLDIHKCDNFGQTPLFIACKQGGKAIAEHLLNQKDIDINKPDKKGETPLMIACYYGKKEIVALLLEQKDINIKIQDKNGGTAIDRAVASNKEAEVQLLLSYAKEHSLPMETIMSRENFNILFPASEKPKSPVTSNCFFSTSPPRLFLDKDSPGVGNTKVEGLGPN